MGKFDFFVQHIHEMINNFLVASLAKHETIVGKHNAEQTFPESLLGDVELTSSPYSDSGTTDANKQSLHRVRNWEMQWLMCVLYLLVDPI